MTPPSVPSHPSKQRRELRITLPIDIEVSGIDRAGHPFRASTKTHEVSEWGCSFYLPFELDKDAIVSVSVIGKQPYCLSETEFVIFQIMNSQRNGDGWLLGASKAQPERLWNLDGAQTPSGS